MTDKFYQDLINAMHENVAIVDETGCIIHVNSSWDAFSAHNSGNIKHTSLGANYFTAVDEAAKKNDEFALKVKAGIQQILLKEITCFELEYPCHSKSEDRWFIANIQEIGSYTPRLFLCTHKDISNLVLRETKVLEAQRLEAVGQLSAGIAHDFNNLLGVLMGNIEVAQLKIANGHMIDDYLKRSLVAIDKGASLIQKLLSFARKQDLLLESIDVNSFIQTTLNLMHPLLGEDITILTELDNSPMIVEVDNSLLSSAILNIAINARQAMPNGGELKVHVSREELNGVTFITSNEKVFGSYALIAISDTGSGIESDDLNKIFEPFFTTKGIGEGSGLGLSMVYGFMKQSNGYIHLTTERAKGTTIFLYLPLSNQKKLEDNITTQNVLETPVNKTILLVEDNEDFLDTFSTMLINLGYQVIQSNDGKQALDILKDQADKIDIVLTDIIMPSGISGIKLAKDIHHVYPNIKILLMSGYPEQNLTDSDRTLFPAILKKPFSLSELVNAIQEL